MSGLRNITIGLLISMWRSTPNGIVDWHELIDRVWNTKEWKKKVRVTHKNRNKKYGETSSRHMGVDIVFRASKENVWGVGRRAPGDHTSPLRALIPP
ncbi:hypothetical protein L1987_24420 [Smallanthus sonchifolius]|uniref:Uncharacterized protein n=1 Tax=Smallanthus sonchifolius TaxID=185202 RepID=A0ACB9IKD1_9ASTR|nr:hypothetical protein L1987_24420 [Smallanthus sonchifolius]